MQHGVWEKDGPDTYEEVYKGDLKHHASPLGDKAKHWLETVLGLWATSLTDEFSSLEKLCYLMVTWRNAHQEE